MSSIDEIRFGFSNIAQTGGIFVIQLESEEAGGSWVFRNGEAFGVAVRLENDVKVSERFATAILRTEWVEINSRQHNLLLLENSDESLSNEFAWICNDFVQMSHRKELQKDPSLWWRQWKNLIGNSVREQTVHGLLGELLAYTHLVEAKAEGVSWGGPEKKSHDIESSATDYEVKSTTARYEQIISVAGQFQLEAKPGRPLKLLYCRFEKVSNGGMSIESAVNRLCELGIERNGLEKKLSKLGFEAGRSARKEQFMLHEGIKCYEVDDSFPKITPGSFSEGRMPDAVRHLTYQLDLGGLASVLFDPGRA